MVRAFLMMLTAVAAVAAIALGVVLATSSVGNPAIPLISSGSWFTSAPPLALMTALAVVVALFLMLSRFREQPGWLRAILRPIFKWEPMGTLTAA